MRRAAGYVCGLERAGRPDADLLFEAEPQPGPRRAAGEGRDAAGDSSVPTQAGGGIPHGALAYRLAREKKVPTPIMDEVYALLYEGKEAKRTVRDLISRTFKAED